MRLRRRRWLLAAGLAAAVVPAGLARPSLAQGAGGLGGGPGGGPVGGRDLLGRAVRLPRPARRLVLAQGRHVVALNLLHPDPASLLVGWGEDLRRADRREYAAYAERFPSLDALPLLDRELGGLAAEQILSWRPDLVLLSRVAAGRGGPPEGNPLLRALDAGGVPSAVVDFFGSPLRDTAPSLALLGALLGREEQATALIDFHRERMAAVAARLDGAAPRPLVFVHAHAGGTDCCFSPGRGVYDDFVRAAGGVNLGAELIPGQTGQVGLEQLLTRDPAVYVATGGPYTGRGGVALGVGVGADEARDSLRAVLRSQRLESLGAVRSGRAHAMWHGFNDTPAHPVAVEALLGWLHPERAAGLDPAATLAELNRRFAALPMQGTYWTDA